MLTSQFQRNSFHLPQGNDINRFFFTRITVNRLIVPNRPSRTRHANKETKKSDDKLTTKTSESEAVFPIGKDQNASQRQKLRRSDEQHHNTRRASSLVSVMKSNIYNKYSAMRNVPRRNENLFCLKALPFN